MNHGVFRAKKMIKIVRNPLDSILSYCHGLWTMSHAGTPVEQYDKDLPEEFDNAIKAFSKGMADDHEITIQSETSI